MASVGGTAATNLGGPNFGGCSSISNRRSEAPAERDDLIRSSAPNWRASRDEGLPRRTRPPFRSAARSPRASTSSRCSRPTAPRLYTARRRMEKAISEQWRMWTTRPSTMAVTTPQVNVTIDRDKAAAVGVNANRSKTRLYDAYGPRWVSTIYALDERVQGAAGTEPKYQTDPRRSPCSISSRPRASWFRWIPWPAMVSDDRAADHQSLRPVSGGHGFLQPEAGCLAGRRGHSDQRHRRPRTLPETVSTRFQGAAKAFQSFAGQPGGAAGHRR